MLCILRLSVLILDLLSGGYGDIRVNIMVLQVFFFFKTDKRGELASLFLVHLGVSGYVENILKAFAYSRFEGNSFEQ